MKEVYTLEDLRRWPDVTAREKPPFRLAVIGDPVAHSASPAMHNAALEACGIDARYTRLHIRREELAEAFSLLPRHGFIGVNCTIPHKAEALRLVHRADDHARRIGVVNTVLVEGESLAGFSTDGPGLVRAVRAEFGVDLRDLRVLVLGAGGAGRAIAMQCALVSCKRLVLVNRTPEKARALAAELAPFFRSVRDRDSGERLEITTWDDASIQAQLHSIDLLIHCTALGMMRHDPSPLPGAVLPPHLLVYDTVYTAARTPLMLAADAAGAKSANGLSMLLHQGALAFGIWFGRLPPLEKMHAALLSHTGSLHR